VRPLLSGPVGPVDAIRQLLSEGRYRDESSLNGFTAAEFVAIGQRAGLKSPRGISSGLVGIPVPCAVHLKVQHFVWCANGAVAFTRSWIRWLTGVAG